MSKVSPISTLESVNNILRARKTIDETMIGERHTLLVKGNGNVVPVLNKEGDNVPAADGSGQMLEKKIFNLDCNSAIALNNERNDELLRAGYTAEQAGDTVQAAFYYNEYLNKVRVSINVLSTNALFTTLQNGDEVLGTVQKITTDKGSILTLDSKSIAIKKAGQAKATTFSVMDRLKKLALPVSETSAQAPSEAITAPTTFDTVEA